MEKYEKTCINAETNDFDQQTAHPFAGQHKQQIYYSKRMLVYTEMADPFCGQHFLKVEVIWMSFILHTTLQAGTESFANFVRVSQGIG